MDFSLKHVIWLTTVTRFHHSISFQHLRLWLSFVTFTRLIRAVSVTGLSLPWLPSDLTSACFSSMSQTSWRRACIKTTTATATSPRSWSRTLLTSRRATSPSRGQYESNRSTRCRRHTATEFVQVSLIPAPSLFYKNITWNDREKM